MTVIQKLPPGSGSITEIKNPRACWKIVRNAAGCPDLRLHDLRHSFASAALAAGLDLAQIGELLGHQSAQTTKGYAHLMEEVGREGAALTGREISRRMKGNSTR
jgi:site-specific recombinase XerD